MPNYEVSYHDSSGSESSRVIEALHARAAIDETVGDLSSCSIWSRIETLSDMFVAYETPTGTIVHVSANITVDGLTARTHTGAGGVEWVDNDGGRSELDPLLERRLHGAQGDCVVRALAIAGSRSYNDVWDMVVEATGGDDPDRGVMDVHWLPIADRLGFEQVWVSDLTGHKTTSVKRAAKLAPNCIVASRGHVAAVVDGKLHDTWDSSNRRIEYIVVKELP